MASIYCPNCGTPNDSTATFCGNCGNTMQAPDAATSRSSQGSQSSMQLPPPPPLFSGGNASSAINYPAAGTPPFAGGNTPSAVNYPAAGTPPFPARNTPSAPTHPAAGMSPPAYPIGSTPSAPTYPAGGTPPPSYQGASGVAFPTHPASATPPPYQPGNMPSVPKGPDSAPPPKRRKGRGGAIAIIIIVLIIILGGGGAGAYLYLTHNAKSPTANVGTPGTTPTTVPTATTAPTQPPTATPAITATVTAGPTATTSSTTPGTTPTASGSSPNSYSATQPGPGCDTGGGTWTPQGIDQISCGTTLTINSNNSLGYLYLQLPNSQPFATDNAIGVTGNVSGGNGNDCVGLAELGANIGYLAEYCSGGGWAIDSISSTGAVVKTISQNITSTRSTEQLSLSLKGTTLTFTIDSEPHSVTVDAMQPVKVAITFFAYYGGDNVTVTNFSYITPSS
jgi:hypothetical protein